MVSDKVGFEFRNIFLLHLFIKNPDQFISIFLVERIDQDGVAVVLDLIALALAEFSHEPCLQRTLLLRRRRIVLGTGLLCLVVILRFGLLIPILFLPRFDKLPGLLDNAFSIVLELALFVLLERSLFPLFELGLSLLVHAFGRIRGVQVVVACPLPAAAGSIELASARDEL